MPVLRNSIEAGTFEKDFFSVPAKGETDRMLNKVRPLIDVGKKLAKAERAKTIKLSVKDRLIASLTTSAVRVYQELLMLARTNQGQVYPSYNHLADRTGLGYATVARSITTLVAIGLVVKQRRFVKTNREGEGKRYEQTSNAYRVALPDWVCRYLPLWMRPAPLPVDEEQRQLDSIEQTGAMLATLSCREYAKATVSGPLASVLLSLGAALDRKECEYHSGTQPLTDSIINGVEASWSGRPTRNA